MAETASWQVRATLQLWGFNLVGMSDADILKLYRDEVVKRWSAVSEAATKAAEALEVWVKAFGKTIVALNKLKPSAK